MGKLRKQTTTMNQTTSAILASVLVATTNAAQLHAQGPGPIKGIKKGWNNFTDVVEDTANATNKWFRGDFADFWREDFVDTLETIGDGFDRIGEHLETGFDKSIEFTSRFAKEALSE